nr:MAG TPA: hypothetical protein [Caudoviricetes sp.]
MLCPWRFNLAVRSIACRPRPLSLAMCVCGIPFAESQRWKASASWSSVGTNLSIVFFPCLKMKDRVYGGLPWHKRMPK